MLKSQPWGSNLTKHRSLAPSGPLPLSPSHIHIHSHRGNGYRWPSDAFATISADCSKQGIGYRWPCAILGWLVTPQRIYFSVIKALKVKVFWWLLHCYNTFGHHLSWWLKGLHQILLISRRLVDNALCSFTRPFNWSTFLVVLFISLPLPNIDHLFKALPLPMGISLCHRYPASIVSNMLVSYLRYWREFFMKQGKQ